MILLLARTCVRGSNDVRVHAFLPYIELICLINTVDEAHSCVSLM